MSGKIGQTWGTPAENDLVMLPDRRRTSHPRCVAAGHSLGK